MFRDRFIVLLFRDLQIHAELLADIGTGAPLVLFQLGDALSSHIDVDPVGSFDRLAVILHGSIVKIEGVASSDHIHGSRNRKQDKNGQDSEQQSS